MWKAKLEKLISRLTELVVKKDDYAYFTQGAFPVGEP